MRRELSTGKNKGSSNYTGSETAQNLNPSNATAVTVKAQWQKTVTNFDYTGGQQTFTAPVSGYYKLEVWGAEGGKGLVGTGTDYVTDTSGVPGYGSYSVGIIQLGKNAGVYIYVGGKGKTPTTSDTTYIAGGYNGGGQGGYGGKNAAALLSARGFAGGGSGGGATHIADISGELKTLSGNKNKVYIVASGGGGSSWSARSKSVSHTFTVHGSGGNGGGITGVNGQNGANANSTVDYAYGGTGGTQTAAGSNGGHSDRYILVNEQASAFGLGGRTGSYNSSDPRAHGGGGGGGWYGGGAGGTSMPGVESGGGGAGGSGYIGNSLLLSSSSITKHMTCYSCTTSTAAATRTNSNTNAATSAATADRAKLGNGYARITYLGTSI